MSEIPAAGAGLGVQTASMNDPVESASRLPEGARFHRCAFQINPHHYAGTYRGEASPLGEADYLAALLGKAKALDITVLAVTDHNHVGGVESIRAEARQRGIHVFPGFELTSTEGIHVLCLYPPDEPVHQLERFLGEFGVRATTATSAPCKKSLSDVLEGVRSQGGVAIAAHVTGASGLVPGTSGAAADPGLAGPEPPRRADSGPGGGPARGRPAHRTEPQPGLRPEARARRRSRPCRRQRPRRCGAG